MPIARALALLHVLVATSGCFCGEVLPGPSQVALWDKHIKGRPNPRILDNFEVIEGLTLLRAAGSVEERTAAFASVAFHTGSVAIREFQLRPDKVFPYAEEAKGQLLSEKQKKELTKLSAKAFAQYGKRPPAPFHGTYMLGNALSLQLTLKRARSIEKCVERIARFHGWLATLESSRDCSSEKYKEAIDKGIPILLQRGRAYRVCFGYLQITDKEYVILADPNGIPLESAPGVLLPSEREAAKTDPWARRIMEDDLKTKFPTDLRTRVSMPLLPGMSVEEFEGGKYTAYFIHDWRVSPEAWREEILKIVGKPREK